MKVTALFTLCYFKEYKDEANIEITMEIMPFVLINYILSIWRFPFL